MAAKSAISLLSTFDKAAPVAAPTIKTAENKSPSKASLWRGCSFIETPASILFLAVSVSFGDITSAADSFSDELTAFLPLAHHLATPSQVSVPMTPIVCHQAPVSRPG